MGLAWMFESRPRRKPVTRPAEVRSVAVVAGSAAATTDLADGLLLPVLGLFQRENWELVYCGMGGGLAGTLARAHAAKGGKVKAVLATDAVPPDLPDFAEPVWADDLFERTSRLVDVADAVLILPGGMGTVAELTTIAAHHGVGLLRKPVVVYDPHGWFKPIIEFYRMAIRKKACPVPMFGLFQYVTSPRLLRGRLKRNVVGWYGGA